MLNILVNAYAVSPNWGSEPGLGWNWVVNLGKYCNVFVITEEEHKEEIEKALCNLPQKHNIHFYYNPVAPKVRQMCKRQGDWRFYKYYRQWQEKTLQIAQEIVINYKIDIIHQLNMIGFREPGSLWKINNIPFVWGPIGGYGWTTLKYLKGQSFNVKFKSILKNLINYLQGRFYPLSNKVIRKADYVLAANSNVYDYIKKHHRPDVTLMNETGCYENIVPISVDEHDIFRILWVGKFDYRKQLDLAIRTLSILKKDHPNVHLDIVGDINNPTYKRLSKIVRDSNLEKNVKWWGKIPNHQVHHLMQESDVFLFTSIDEGTPHVVLESIQNNLPIVCFDTCGQGDVVNDSVGIKIPLTDSNKSPYHFAEALGNLIMDRDKLRRMKTACPEYQKKLSWDSKVRYMVDIYHTILQDHTT